MKKVIYIIFAISLFHQLTGAQWVQQESGVTTPLYNVQFVNRLTGWVTGSNSVILKTTNGGANWFSQTIDLVYPKRLYGLCMVNETTGYIAGGFETILKTTNSGINWNIISNIPTNDGNSNNAVSFINTETGWICSFLGRVLKTTNGGVFWDTSNVGNTGPLLDIQFLNSQTGWVCGDVGNLNKSTNGGINWISQPLLTTSNLTGLHFINVNTGWVVSEQTNYVFRTIDAGSRWDTLAQLPVGMNNFLYSVFFNNFSTGWIGGTNTRLYKTSNGGYNWIQQVIPTPMYMSNMSFYNDTIGWIAGGNQGKIIHTSNGGTHVAVEPLSNITPLSFNLNQNYPNPFNPNTTIEFELPIEDNIKILVHDILGRVINTIIENRLKAGKHKVDFDAAALSSGVYFYTLYHTYGKITKKMILNR